MSLSVMEVVLPYLIDELDGFSTFFNVAENFPSKSPTNAPISAFSVGIVFLFLIFFRARADRKSEKCAKSNQKNGSEKFHYTLPPFLRFFAGNFFALLTFDIISRVNTDTIIIVERAYISGFTVFFVIE